ncbi:MAG: hypothetical protein JSS95_17880 [Acidobacteria bacterium]|nr:hypothetical protein [Acidobacteriota bacterium]
MKASPKDFWINPLLQPIYQLRFDHRHIELVQRATLTTKEYGIQQTHGLFGSPEWWDNIRDGKLRLYTVRGVIKSAFMAGHNDWPMCEVLSDDGALSQWTREMNDAASDSLYRAGTKIEIDYVLQQSKPDSWTAGAEQKCVTEVRIEK